MEANVHNPFRQKVTFSNMLSLETGAPLEKCMLASSPQEAKKVKWHFKMVDIIQGKGTKYYLQHCLYNISGSEAMLSVLFFPQPLLPELHILKLFQKPLAFYT